MNSGAFQCLGGKTQGGFHTPRHSCVACTSRLPRCHLLPRAQPSDSGNPNVQESLVDMLQLELAKAKIREDMQNDLELRKESIKQIGQELAEEFEKKLELDKMRMDLASSSSLADTLAQFKELDDEIQGIRDQLQADKKDLAAFETRSATERNGGLFFKQLYKGPDEEEEEGDGQKAPAQGRSKYGKKEKKKQVLTLEEQQAVQQLTSDIKSPAVREVHSPLRLYIFTYLALVLMGVAASDLGSTEPSLPQDALYVALALGLGWNAWQERQALTKAMDDEPPSQGPP